MIIGHNEPFVIQQSPNGQSIKHKQDRVSYQMYLWKIDGAYHRRHTLCSHGGSFDATEEGQVQASWS